MLYGRQLVRCRRRFYLSTPRSTPLTPNKLPLTSSYILTNREAYRAGKRLVEGIASDWFEARPGLRKRCDVPPLLFHVFFAAVRNTEERQFMRDPDVVVDLDSMG